jgi:hypothetical protein
MIEIIKKYQYIFLIFCVSSILFWQFFIKGLIPLPADTIVGMYHPWRDLYAKDYPNGIPYNNPLITDPVRQQFVWKKLVSDSYKVGKLPIENPYSFSGYPLLANFQSGAFYPLNILFLILPFNFAWGVYIYLQFLLGGVFMFAFLQNLLKKNANPEGASATEGSPDKKNTTYERAAFLGSIVWILSGFWIAWSEWGNILHTALWLPLILLSISSLSFSRRRESRLFWLLIYLTSLLCSFFAGHLQTFFYLYIFSIVYFLFLLRTTNYVLRTISLFIILNSIFLILAIPQWYPTLQFILQSARSTDITNILTREDWFIPLKHFVQFFIPDYFGNPAKGNYFGVWNYGEFLSYIGIIPIFFAIFGIIKSIKNKKNIFWLISLIVVLMLTTKNPISQIPYQLQIPFFSTAQPSRLIFLLDFILIILYAKGLIIWSNDSNHRIKIISSVLFSILLIVLLMFSMFDKTNQIIILRNSIQPVVIFILFSLMITNIARIPRIFKISKIFFPAIFLLIFFDQSRVFWKFNTFADQKYIFPDTKITTYLQNDLKNGFFRISSLSDAIMPPNFSAFYGIPSIDGYDPLYFSSYADLIRSGKNAGFNRIIRLDYPDRHLFEELKVKYFLTFSDFSGLKDFELVLTEGITKLYKYTKFK